MVNGLEIHHINHNKQNLEKLFCFFFLFISHNYSHCHYLMTENQTPHNEITITHKFLVHPLAYISYIFVKVTFSFALYLIWDIFWQCFTYKPEENMVTNSIKMERNAFAFSNCIYKSTKLSKLFCYFQESL